MAPSAQAKSEPASARARILLVDDEPGLREAVQAYLEDSGFEVIPAANAQQALQLLSTTQPQLIISDIMMPGMDGYQFLAQVRKLDPYSHLPVVFLTAKGMTADRIQGYRAGVDAYLPKPFDPEELVAIVSNLIERSRAASPSEVVARELASIRALLSERTLPPTIPSQPFFHLLHCSDPRLGSSVNGDTAGILAYPSSQLFVALRMSFYAVDANRVRKGVAQNSCGSFSTTGPYLDRHPQGGIPANFCKSCSKRLI